MDPPGRASPGGNPGAANRARGAPADGSQAARQRHHDAAHPRLYPEEQRPDRRAGPRTRHPQPDRGTVEGPHRGARSLDPAASAGHHNDGLGRSPDRRVAPQPRLAARRHHRGDAALRQSPAVAQRHPPLLAAARISARLTPDKAPAAAFQTAARPGSSTSMSNTCRRSTGAAVTPMSPSIAPPALSISKCCPIAGAKPPPAFSIASAPASRSRSIPC